MKKAPYIWIILGLPLGYLLAKIHWLNIYGILVLVLWMGTQIGFISSGLQTKAMSGVSILLLLLGMIVGDGDWIHIWYTVFVAIVLTIANHYVSRAQITITRVSDDDRDT